MLRHANVKQVVEFVRRDREFEINPEASWFYMFVRQRPSDSE